MGRIKDEFRSQQAPQHALQVGAAGAVTGSPRGGACWRNEPPPETSTARPWARPFVRAIVCIFLLAHDVQEWAGALLPRGLWSCCVESAASTDCLAACPQRE